jgi:hypothetical protein
VAAMSIVESRAGELLLAGRVRVREADRSGRIVAEVLGTEDVHTVTRTPAGRWRCTCEAATFGSQSCAHRAAARMVASPLGL